jgi:hypothetical protein
LVIEAKSVPEFMGKQTLTNIQSIAVEVPRIHIRLVNVDRDNSVDWRIGPSPEIGIVKELCVELDFGLTGIRSLDE